MYSRLGYPWEMTERKVCSMNWAELYEGVTRLMQSAPSATVPSVFNWLAPEQDFCGDLDPTAQWSTRGRSRLAEPWKGERRCALVQAEIIPVGVQRKQRIAQEPVHFCGTLGMRRKLGMQFVIYRVQRDGIPRGKINDSDCLLDFGINMPDPQARSAPIVASPQPVAIVRAHRGRKIAAVRKIMHRDQVRAIRNERENSAQYTFGNIKAMG